MRAEHEKTLAGLVLALGVAAALYFPDLTSALAPYLLHSLFFVMVFSLLPFARLRMSELVRPHPVVWALVVWQQFAVPALVLLFGYMSNMDQQWLLFLLLTVTSGSLFASPTLVQVMGLEQKVAVQSVVLSTLAAPISIYMTFTFVMGGNLNLDLGLFAYRLVIFLAVPIFLFCIVRLLTRNWSEAAKDRLDGFGRWGSVLALVIFCFALEDGVAQAIEDDPETIFEYLLLAITSVAVISLVTRLVMARFGARAAMTATILTSFRNVGLTFGLVGPLVGPELAVYVGVCQIPMFFAPLLFDLLIGNSSYSSDDNKAIETDAGPETPEFHRPQAQGSGAGSAGANHGYASSPVQSTQAYYQSGNTLVVAERSDEQVVAAKPAIADPAEVVDLHSDQEFRFDLEREDARALIARVERSLWQASHKLRHYEEAEENRHACYYVACFILVCLLGLTGVWHLNKHFSPMLFDDKLIDRVAQAHVNGQNFGVFDLNINIRDLRDATIARLPEVPEVVVLGASHWQEAHVNLMPNRRFYNSHVHRDYYEDMLAVTEMWLRHGKLPQEMIITIRDNLLTPVGERTDFLWLPGIKYYRMFADRIGLKAHSHLETLPVNTWRELLSLPLLYSQAERQLTALLQPHASAERNFDTLDTLLPGGSILWSGEHKRLFTAERARAEALKFAMARRDDPPKIDPQGIAHLEALFEFLKEQGVKVTLAHPQFNPIFWDAVKDSPYMDGLQKIVDLTQNWSRKYGFPVIGGFSPESVGCSADMYIDAEHGNATCLGMLLNQYPLKDRAASSQPIQTVR